MYTTTSSEIPAFFSCSNSSVVKASTFPASGMRRKRRTMRKLAVFRVKGFIITSWERKVPGPRGGKGPGAKIRGPWGRGGPRGTNFVLPDEDHPSLYLVRLVRPACGLFRILVLVFENALEPDVGRHVERHRVGLLVAVAHLVGGIEPVVPGGHAQVVEIQMIIRLDEIPLALSHVGGAGEGVVPQRVFAVSDSGQQVDRFWEHPVVAVGGEAVESVPCRRGGDVRIREGNHAAIVVKGRPGLVRKNLGQDGLEILIIPSRVALFLGEAAALRRLCRPRAVLFPDDSVPEIQRERRPGRLIIISSLDP